MPGVYEANAHALCGWCRAKEFGSRLKDPVKPGKGFSGEEGWGDPTSFVLLRIALGQSGEWAGRDWLENREAVGAYSWGTGGLG